MLHCATWKQLSSLHCWKSGSWKFRHGRRTTLIQILLRARSLITLTQAAVRSQLAESEAQDLQAGINHSLDINVSPSVLISGGIELEDMQQRLKYDIANLLLHPTDKQREAIIHRTSTLQRHIDSWTHYQQLYMPIISMLCSSADMSASAPQAALRPQDFPLYLPSALNYLNCDRRLMEYKWELRWAQAHDALSKLCSHLHLHSHMYKFKDKHLRGQAASTHAQNLIASVEAKKDAAVDKYKCAHQALESLSSWVDKMGWKERLQPLRHEDALCYSFSPAIRMSFKEKIKGIGKMSSGEQQVVEANWQLADQEAAFTQLAMQMKELQPMGDFAAGHSQGTGTISWIWLVSDGDTSHSENEHVQDCVHVEWCKACGCAA
ncbi:hypothetical protein BDR06DRAFT_975718 [Suillus hirtellus]|nr:hypothetical protein BDR06DRAFT_975718 [Suillus hirtellus]